MELTPDIKKKVDSVLLSHKNDGSQLVGILLDVQALMPRQYISRDVADYVAKTLEIKPTQVYDVLSFYSALSTKPRAQYVIQFCDSIVCGINHNKFLLETLEEILGITFGQVTYDGKFTLEKTTCFGACDKAPAVRINGIVYGRLDSREKIQDMINNLL